MIVSEKPGEGAPSATVKLPTKDDDQSNPEEPIQQKKRIWLKEIQTR
jgi:hypothetical protein